MGPRTVFLLIMIVALGATSVAYADIPTVNYLYEFYRGACNNSYLVIPGAGGTSIASRSYTLGLVDAINENQTSYRADSDGDAIVSVGYLSDTLNFLSNSPVCCPGGYYDSGETRCKSCGAWSVVTTHECLAEGEYLNGSLCSACPSGYICPAGTSGKISSKLFLVQCLSAGEYRLQNTCVPCGAGYLCPAGQNNREDCGTGNWCTDGIATQCVWGANQCPGLNHTNDAEPVACDNALTFTN